MRVNKHIRNDSNISYHGTNLHKQDEGVYECTEVEGLYAIVINGKYSDSNCVLHFHESTNELQEGGASTRYYKKTTKEVRFLIEE